MRASAFRSILYLGAHGALPLMAHPHRWAVKRDSKQEGHGIRSSRRRYRFSETPHNDWSGRLSNSRYS